MRTYRQDSDDTKRYTHYWSDQLAEDAKVTGVTVTISTSAWTVTTLTTANETIKGETTYVELSGGVAGTTYKAENKITTSEGLVHTKSFKVMVVDK